MIAQDEPRDDENIPVVLFSSKPTTSCRTSRSRPADPKSHGINKLGDMIDEFVDSILW